MISILILLFQYMIYASEYLKYNFKYIFLKTMFKDSKYVFLDA